MHPGHARAQTLLAILAFSALAASEGAAAQTVSDIGPRSRATLHIRVSVAERAGLRMSWAEGVPGVAPCVFSTVRARTFAATLQARGSSERPAPRPFELKAAPAGEACSANGDLDRALAALRKDGSPGPHLLILAPQ